ncbi:MAG: hypothetical protein ACR2OI_10450, partial [Acidimicrobiia bacterium]
MTNPAHEADVLTAFEDDIPLAGTRPSRRRQLLKRYLPAAVAFVGVLVVWELFVELANVKSFILPAPSEITAAFFEEFSTIWSAGWTTLREAVGGLIIGLALAVLVSFS